MVIIRQRGQELLVPFHVLESVLQAELHADWASASPLLTCHGILERIYTSSTTLEVVFKVLRKTQREWFLFWNKILCRTQHIKPNKSSRLVRKRWLLPFVCILYLYPHKIVLNECHSIVLGLWDNLACSNGTALVQGWAAKAPLSQSSPNL